MNIIILLFIIIIFIIIDFVVTDINIMKEIKGDVQNRP